MLTLKIDKMIYTKLIISTGLILLTSCEDPVREEGPIPIELENTLSESDLGGKTGNISDYFYNFNSNVDVEFYRFLSDYYTFDYTQYLALLGEEPPVLSLYSFPEYLVEITPQDATATKWSPIDSLTFDGVIRNDSVLISSTRFKNIEKLVWDKTVVVDQQRYRFNTSEWVLETTTVTYKDTLDEIAYRAVVDTPLIDQGVLLVDEAEWVDTTYQYVADEPLVFSHVFNHERKRISSDSIMFRLNTDCNDNGLWDDAETEDTGNGIWDPAEPYYETGEDSVRGENEPYQDRNCNGDYDDAEVFTDANGNDQYDEGEEFDDVGNGILDGVEAYTDLNGNGQPDAGELFLFNRIPNRLLVDWSDPRNPRVLDTIEPKDSTQVGGDSLVITPGDSLVTRWGQTYHDIIEEIVFNDFKTVEAFNQDSLVTLYTNQVIGHIIDNGSTDDYFIVKTEWDDVNTEGNDYDYLLFKENEHIYKLVKPSFFKPYGYYWSEVSLAVGFWHKNQFADEVVYYAVNGLLREGEVVETSYYDTTSVAVYQVERSFSVAVEDVRVPAKTVRGFIKEDGQVECYAISDWNAADISDCPGADTTFTDVFKITNALTQTMIGTGVVYGERNTTWLVAGRGIVRDELQIRWSESPFSNSERWIGLSKWELGRISTTASDGPQTAQLLKQAHIVKLNELQSIPELKDPFQIKRTAGLQRVELPQ